MPINPADFSTTIDNKYFPLKPGTTFVFETPDGSEVVRFQVTRETRVVDGVTCVVVHDRSFVDGKLHEDTLDYFAQDTAGNVWYFGEEVKNIQNGQVINTNGSWLAGVNGAAPGIVMQANPIVGQVYNQENAIGVAQDTADVVSITGFAETPYASVSNVLQTHEFTPLDPRTQEYKTYKAGIGQMLSISLTTGDSEKLVRIEFDGTQGKDTIVGNIGFDILRGHGGNDKISGLGGNDILTGGDGRDFMFGGAGHDTFDFNRLSNSGIGAERDVIGDFQHKIDDIDLKTIDASMSLAGNQAFAFIGEAAFHNVAGELRFQKIDQTGTAHDRTLVSGDVNGDGKTDFQIELTGLKALTANDFVL